MEIDDSPSSSPRLPSIIIQRLIHLGVVPKELLRDDDILHGLVVYVTENNSTQEAISSLVSAILPTYDDMAEAVLLDNHHKFKSPNSTNFNGRSCLRLRFHESILCLQWLMFQGDPGDALLFLAQESVGVGGVCGAVWGKDDIAYKCRTCESDPTCAVCVPCFQNGDHKDHDYSIIYTGIGCCDCGDVTAWNRAGFCSNHKGVDQIKPLQANFANSMGPVIHALLACWKQILLDANSLLGEPANEMTFVIVDMFLEFCKQSESLLGFVSGKVSSFVGLLDILVRAEMFLNKLVTGKLHELLLKLLGDPAFKYEFAKVFLSYYPVVVNEAIKRCSDTVWDKYPLLFMFSVQLFTVPTLTPRLVKENNVLYMLLGCLEDIFISCANKDCLLQGDKWGHLYGTIVHIVRDVQYVLSHVEVPNYVTHEEPHLLQKWLRLLAFVQGMDPQKREKRYHVEEENENIHLAFLLGHSLAKIHSDLADAVCKAEEPDDEIPLNEYELDSDDEDGLRPAKVRRLSREILIPSSVSWLILECLRAMEKWLTVDNIYRSHPYVLSPRSDSVIEGLTYAEMDSEQLLERDGKPMAYEELCPEALPLLSFSDWPGIVYDVSSKNISAHIPVHRLLSLLLQKALRLCFDESEIPHTSNCTSADAISHCDFFGHVLGGVCHPNGFSAFLMEHPLRIRVFCAQVLAGMWKKNGDAAILSSELYRVRWPNQTLELDLFLLQCCAALAPADLYVNRILERFGLSSYLSLNIEWSSEYEPVLLQEMLTLLIQVVKERRFCGLTVTECLKRELIYKLVIRDATHSQIVKSLPRDLSKSDQLHAILDTIAEYSHPSGIKQGMYSLRHAFWKELDLYHPRWNQNDLQVAEERYVRFHSSSAWITQLPKWTKIYHPLSGVARMATCKKVLQIIRAVLFYAIFTDKSNAPRSPDGVLLTALHLLSLALDICSVMRESGDGSCNDGDSIPVLGFACEDIEKERSKMCGEQSLLSLLVLLMGLHKKEDRGSFMEAGNYDISSFIKSLLKKFAELDFGCMLRLQKLAPEVVNDSSQSVTVSDANIGTTSESKKHKTKARERQMAIMEKMKAEQTKFLASIDSNADDGINCLESELNTLESNAEELESGDSAKDICSLCHDQNSKNPLSFLILLQKSRLLSFVDRGPPSWDKSCKLGKKQLPGPRSKLVNQLGVNTSSSASEMIPPFQLVQLIENVGSETAHDEQPVEVSTFLKFITARFPTIWSSWQPCTSSDDMDGTSYSYETMEEDLFIAIREKILSPQDLDLIKDDRKKRCANKEGPQIQDADFSLFGKCITLLSKTNVSSLNGDTSRNGHTPSESTAYLLPYDGYGPSDCDGIHLSSCGHAVHQECLDRYITSFKQGVRNLFEGWQIVDQDQLEFLCPVCRRQMNSILPKESQDVGKNKALSASLTVDHLDTLNRGISFPFVRQALVLLKSAANTVGSCNVLQALHMHKSGRTKQNLQPILSVLLGMYVPEKKDMVANASHSIIMWDTLRYSLISTEIAARSGESRASMLSLLLKIVQSSKQKDPTQVLLRFTALQLFTASLCSDKSIDNFIWSTSERQEKKPSIVDHVEDGIPYLDIQFLKEACGSILARDPFSSLMWILFCLPSPFLSCEHSFLSLVHIFYTVSVAQSIITYFAKLKCKISEIGLPDCMVTDILKYMESIPPNYFASNYVDPSCDMNDVIRSLSFPYLRRCVLLSKLARDNVHYDARELVQTFYHIDDTVDFNYISKAHLSEVQNLEIMFQIPSLDHVLRDEMLRSLVLKWLRHFCSEFEVHSPQRVLFSTPAVPFTLMHLPNLYQDVVQRYIKQKCPVCETSLDEPALCLLCGRLCSPHSRNLCCRKNGCKTHATSCGAGMGVFLLIRKTTIMLQRSDGQAPWPSLYLDAFGEEDVEMARGRPLYLNKERYETLSFMVASHSLDWSSRVLPETAFDFP